MIGTIDYDINNPPENLKTQFGNARITPNGYYQITSYKEGFQHELLHRLIFEEFYNIKISEMFPNQEMVIHHIDGNKVNNNTWNLDIMPRSEHQSFHMKGEKNPNYKKTPSLETIEKIRIGNLGKTHNETAKQQMSKNKSSTGFFRLTKRKDTTCTQGFVWTYRYYIDSKNRRMISRTNLYNLVDAVTNEDLPWLIIDKHKAKQTCIQYGYDFNKLNVEEEN